MACAPLQKNRQHHCIALYRHGVQWVTRAKDNMAYTVRKKLHATALREKSCATTSLILHKEAKSRGQYPETFRRVEMLVEVDGKEVVMIFI